MATTQKQENSMNTPTVSIQNPAPEAMS
jgi:hypothetical protein